MYNRVGIWSVHKMLECNCPDCQNKKACSLSDYGYIYNIGDQTVFVDTDVTFSNNQALQGITHTAGAAEININSSGVYDIKYYVYPRNRTQFELFVNGISPLAVSSSSLYGQSTGNDFTYGQVIANLTIGDTLTLRLRDTSGMSTALVVDPGGALDTVNASITILKIDQKGTCGTCSTC